MAEFQGIKQPMKSLNRCGSRWRWRAYNAPSKLSRFSSGHERTARFENTYINTPSELADLPLRGGLE